MAQDAPPPNGRHQNEDSPQDEGHSPNESPHDEYRGFVLDRFSIGPSGAEEPVLRARRGRLRVFMRPAGSSADLPEGWTHRAVLCREIDRLMDPMTLRDVDHLN